LIEREPATDYREVSAVSAHRVLPTARCRCPAHRYRQPPPPTAWDIFWGSFKPTIQRYRRL